MIEGHDARKQGEFRQLPREKEDPAEKGAIEVKEGSRPGPLPEPKYQNLLDGIRVTVGEQSRDYRGGLDIVTLRGKSIRVIVSSENKDLHGAYNVRDEVINFGKSAIAELETDPDLFWSTCIHELAHMRYFDLDEKTQKDVNDFVVQRFPRELATFQEDLYSAKGGERYIKVHDVTNTSTVVPFRFTGGGLRDWRVMTAKGTGDQQPAVDIRLGLLVTEFLSHISPFYSGSGVFEKELAVNQFDIDKPSFYGAVAKFKKMLDADQGYSAFLKKSGIFIDADPNTREKIFRSVRAAHVRSRKN